jgi:hypothetical protein
MGTRLGLRQVGRRQLWLMMALALTAVIAFPVLVSVMQDTDEAGTEEEADQLAGGSHASAPETREQPEPPPADEESDGDATAEAAEDETDPPPPEPEDGSAAPDDALPEEVLVAFLALTDQALNDPGDLDDEALSRLATGAALQELRSMVLEFSATELRQDGHHELVQMDAGTNSGDEVSIDVCLDSTDVGLLHADGSRVLVEEADPRSLHSFLLRRSAAGWQVAEHRFPEPNGC